MRMESGPDSAYTRTWSPSGEIEYAKLADGTRLRYLKEGSGPTVLIVLHTVRTQLDHFQLVIPKISHAFTVYAIDMPGMGWSDITPGASYTEPTLRRAIVEFVTTLDLNDVTLVGESMGATVSLTASIELVDRVDTSSPSMRTTTPKASVEPIASPRSMSAVLASGNRPGDHEDGEQAGPGHRAAGRSVRWEQAAKALSGRAASGWPSSRLSACGARSLPQRRQHDRRPSTLRSRHHSGDLDLRRLRLVPHPRP